MAVLHRICQQPHRTLRDSQPQLPRQLTQIVDRLLAKDPAARYRTASEVAEALRAMLSDVQAGRIRTRQPRVARHGRRPFGQDIGPLAVGAVAIAALLITGYFAWRFAADPINVRPVPVLADVAASRLDEPDGSPIAAPPVWEPAATELLSTESLIIARDEWIAIDRSLAGLETIRPLPALPEPSDWSQQLNEIEIRLRRLEQSLATPGLLETETDETERAVPPSDSQVTDPLPPVPAGDRHPPAKGSL